jgi:hypothetical protein
MGIGIFKHKVMEFQIVDCLNLKSEISNRLRALRGELPLSVKPLGFAPQ